MKDVLLALLHLAVMAAKLCGPRWVRAVIVENLLLKQHSSSFGVVAGGRLA